MNRQDSQTTDFDLRLLLFRYRGYTPVPVALAVLLLGNPSGISLATGLAIALAGEALRFWGVSVAGSATRTTETAGGDRLITSGPFAYVRNPLYFGNFLIMTGLTIAAWAWMPWMALLVVTLFAIQYGLIISLEEEYLRGRFGATYEHYFRQVPRFLPRLTPYRSPDPASRYDVRAAIRSERSTFLSLGLFVTALIVHWRLL